MTEELQRRYRARIDWNYYLLFLLTWFFGVIAGVLVTVIAVLGFWS